MTDLKIHVRHMPGRCPFGDAGGVDGRFTWLLVWCGCGWNRTRWTALGARQALARHQAGKQVRR